MLYQLCYVPLSNRLTYKLHPNVLANVLANVAACYTAWGIYACEDCCVMAFHQIKIRHILKCNLETILSNVIVVIISKHTVFCRWQSGKDF